MKRLYKASHIYTDQNTLIQYNYKWDNIYKISINVISSFGEKQIYLKIL